MLAVDRKRIHEIRRVRQASSIKIPWALGVLLFGAIAILSVLAFGRTPQHALPSAVHEAYEVAARESAQDVRRSLNEGIDDLGLVIEALVAENTIDDKTLDKVTGSHRGLQTRYHSIIVMDEDTEILARIGRKPAKDAMLFDAFEGKAGIAPAVEHDGEVLVHQYVPFPKPAQGGRPLAIVGTYDVKLIRNQLEAFAPGDAWIVDDSNRIVVARGSFIAMSEIPGRDHREAATIAGRSGTGTIEVPGSSARGEIVAYSPVAGIGPAGELGWSVVTARSTDVISSPETNSRRIGYLLALGIVIATVIVFGWFWVQVISPIDKLEADADRIAYGDLGAPVRAIRYDEIGVIARALERIRISFIGTATSGSDKGSTES